MLFKVCFGVGIALLAACSGHPDPSEKKKSREAPASYLTGAYQEERHYGVQVGHEVLTLPSGKVDAAWLIPQGRALAPLVLYFSGLGESWQGGVQWQNAWAEAGYAVLSVQATSDNETLYNRPEARAGAFQALARSAFSLESLAVRVRLAQQVLAWLTRGIQSGDMRFAAVDIQHLVVAGFDLGAQTAAALVGAYDSDVPVVPELRPVAAVLLSPYAGAETQPEHFASIQVPVLSITGPEDEDPFNWVMTPQQRLKVWQGLQARGSCNLWLTEASHATLSGVVQERLGNPSGPKNPPPSELGNKKGSSKPYAMAPVSVHAAQGGHGGGRGGGPDGVGAGKPSDKEGRSMGHGAGSEPPINARQVAIIQFVSVAFLDARVAKIVEAERWLNQDARSWLDGQGSLAFK